MNRKLFFFIFMMFVLSCEPLYACTSFAVFSNTVYYGMNFDFADLPMKFLILINGDIRSFHLAFERTLGDMKFFVNTVGMNNKGLFASCQELHPLNEHPQQKSDAQMFTFELYQAINTCTCVSEVEKQGMDRPLVDIPGITLHNMFADTNGLAIVTEAGKDKTIISKNKENYMVMTNFPNQSMVGRKYTQAQGKGSDRYIICHEYLRQHAPDFSIEKSFKLLKMCQNKDPEYPTACSMVFDPQKMEVYIVFKTDFDKIMKFSMAKASIENFKGYKKDFEIPISSGEASGTNELMVSDLFQRIKGRTNELKNG